MTDLKRKAAEVAKAGRFSDDVLIHMSRAEVEGLASLMPNGKLPLNPKTGLPEAFFFLPFLAGLGAAGMGAAGAAGALGAGMATGAGAAAGLGGALGAGAAGLGAAAVPAAATGAIGAGLGTTGALTAASALPAATAGLGATGAGLGAAGMGATGATSALLPGAAATGAAGAMGGAMPAITAAGTPALASMPVAGAGGLPSILGGAPLAGTGATGALGSGITATGAATGPGAAMAAPSALGATGAGTVGAGTVAPAAAAANVGKTGLSGLLGGMDMGQMLQYGALASMMMPQGGGGGGDDDDEGKKLENQNYDPGEAEFPTSSPDTGGSEEEFDYFPRSRYFNMGGLVKGASHESFNSEEYGSYVRRKGLDPAREKHLNEMIGKESARQFIEKTEREAKEKASARRWSKAGDKFSERYTPTTANYPKRYADGGIASLGKSGGKMDDEQLVQATMMALQGQSPNADAIIQQFIAEFGREALQDLVARVQGGGGGMHMMPDGSQMANSEMPMSDGMSDSVPAMISGQNGQSQPAQLSEGEFIVPADAVSGLGNGSTDAGAQQLQGMVDRTRMMRNGGMVQPPAINPRMVMPV